MKLLFFSLSANDTNYLLEKELLNSFAKISELELFNLKIGSRYPENELVQEIIKQIKTTQPKVSICINGYGLDLEGEIVDAIGKAGGILINWYMDGVIYHDLHFKIPNGPHVLNLVSDKSYVPWLKRKGYKSAFLPLALDPTIFNWERGAMVTKEHDLSFVGISSLEFVDLMIKEKEEAILNSQKELLNLAKQQYEQDLSFNIHDWLQEKEQIPKWMGKVEGDENFSFLFEWFVGYMVRKNRLW